RRRQPCSPLFPYTTLFRSHDSDRGGQFRAGRVLMLVHSAVLQRQQPHLGRETSPQRGTPTDPRKWDRPLTGRVSWLVDHRVQAAFPKLFASVAAGRTLPTHSCATAPDLNRLPASRELFSCAHHYGRAPAGGGRWPGR